MTRKRLDASTQYLRWFATPVHISRTDALVAHHAEWLAAIYGLQNDAPGISRSNAGGWHSGTELHQHAAFATLGAAVQEAATHMAVEMSIDLDTHQLTLAEMWANINPPGASNHAHVHPGACLSGAYYIRVPKNSGSISFYDPVAARAIAPLPVTAEGPDTSPTISIEPAVGTMLLFPAWLQHGVGHNASEADRVSVSFNIRLRLRTH